MAEKRTIELEIQDNSKTLKQQYKEAVKELQNMVAAYGEMSAEAINAAKRAAELKDQIEDTNDLMKSFKGEGTFIAMGKAMSSVASGFSAVEGGLALVGVESEKVQETMLRVQAAMALAQGLEGLEDAGRAFTLLGTKAKVALQGIKTELIATGIGIFVVALGTAVAYWDDIKAAVGGVSEEQKELNKKVDKQATASKEIYENAQLQENSLRLQGKSEKEILKIRIGKLNTAIADEEARIKGLEATAKLEYDAAVRNKEYATMFFRLWLEGQALLFRAMVAPIDMVLSTANKVSEALGLGVITTSTINEEITKLTKKGADFFAGLLFDPAETKKNTDATIKEANKGLAQMKSDRDGLLLEIKKSDQQGAKDSINTEKGAAQEKIDITRQMEEETNRLMAEGRAKELDALRIKYKYEQQETDKNFKEGKLKQEDYDKLTAQAIESKRLDDKAINDKYDKIEKDALALKNAEQIKLQDEQWYALQKLKNSQKEQELLDLQIAYEKEIEAAKGSFELEKELTEKFNKDYAAINKKYADAEVAAQKVKDAEIAANRKKLHDNSIQAAQDTLQTISNLTELFAGQSVKQQKKAFQIQKAVSISSAVIDTYKAANAAFASSPAPFNFIAMAAAITAGLLNVKKIASQKFEGGGSTGGGGGGSNAPAGAAPMTANFNTIGSSGINQLAQLQQTPTQAYVVSGEVTSAQALDRNRVQNATL
jgi:hypothetical protein